MPFTGFAPKIPCLVVSFQPLLALLARCFSWDSTTRYKSGSTHPLSGVMTMGTLEVYVKGQKIATNRFVRDVLRDVLLAILNNLHDVHVDDITKIEIS